MTAPTGLLFAFAHEVHGHATFLLEEHPALSWEDAVTAALIDPPSFDWGGERPGDGWRRISGYQLAPEDLPRFRAILDHLDHLEES